MSTRERWIVYPLLFLTLGIAMRDFFMQKKHLSVEQLTVGEIDAQRIRCGESQTGKALCNQLESGRSECRELIVLGPTGRPAVIAVADPQSKGGVLETFSADGRPLVQLHSTEAGGIVMTFGRSGRVLIFGDAGQPPANRQTPQPPAAEKPSEKEKPEPPADKQKRYLKE